MIDNITKAWWFMGGGVVNNSYVQAVINKVIADGFSGSIPNSTTLSALNKFFNTIDPVMPKAEMIKITRLWDLDSQEFSKYNYANPSLYKSTYVGGSVLYSLRGVSSDGAGYINDEITMKRRAGLNLDSSSIAVSEAFSDVSLDQAVCGSVSGNFYIIRPYYTGASSYYFNSTHFGVTDTKQNAFSCFSTDGAGGTIARFLQNSTYKNNASVLGAEMTNDIAVFSLAYNNAGTPIRWYTGGNLCFRWEGYELTDSEKELIRDAWSQYVIDITPVWSAGDNITATGIEAFAIIGDSKTGTSNLVGPRCAPNSVLQYNRTSGLIQEVLESDLLNVPSIGSMWPQMGRLINEGTNGKRPGFILSGVGGSAFLNSFASASYDDGTYPTYTGTAYATAKTRFDAGLVAFGLTKLKGIFIILGVNDINRTEPLVSLEAQIDSVFTRLMTHYGSDVPIYISLPQKPSGAAEQPGRLDAIRAKLTAIATANSNITVAIDEVDLFATPAYISGTHFSYDGNIYWANQVYSQL